MEKRMRFVVCLVAVSAWLMVGMTAAVAQSAAQAEAYFQEGKRLMDEGNIEEACEAFEASYGKDPAVSTLLNLANCREKNHQYASAWGHFIDAARLSRGKADLASFNKTASDRATAIEPRLSYLIINVPAEAEVVGLSITLNGKPVTEAEWNRRFPVDGGEYKIEGKAPAHEPWSTTIRIAEAKDIQSVTLPRFHPVASDGPAQSKPLRTEQGNAMSGRRKVAIGAWTAGAAGLGVGLAFELSARSTYDESTSELTDHGRQQELYKSANSKRLVAGVAAGAGVAAIGVGVFLWLTGTSDTERTVTIAPHVAADRTELVVAGRF
jgi:hypothetical protein